MPDSNNINITEEIIEIVDSVDDDFIQSTQMPYEQTATHHTQHKAAFENAINNMEYDIIYLKSGGTITAIPKHAFVPEEGVIYTQKNDTLFATDYTPLGASLEILFFGMAGIFVFMTIFYLLVKVLEKVFKNDENKE